MSLSEEYGETEPYSPDDLIFSQDYNYYNIGFRFKVIRKIGKGGFGVVYLVSSIDDSKIMAVKVLHESFSKNIEVRAAFLREARILVGIDRHPNVITVPFVFDAKDRLHIFMEYIEINDQGCNNLQGYLNYRKPDLNTTLRWAIQFCHGMEYVNSKGIKCHRDIKPQNILITKDGILKISDFGLASITNRIIQEDIELERLKSRLTQPSIEEKYSIIGTLPYMAPEQFRSFDSCDVRTDIYSFGVVLYQMVHDCNKPPFEVPTELNSNNQLEVMELLHNEVQIPVIKSQIFNIIKKCLEKEPSSRYQSFHDLRMDLEKYLIILPEIPKITQLTEKELCDAGNSLLSIRDYTTAIKCYKKVIKLNPKNMVALNGIGSCYLHRGKHKKAIDYYKRMEREDGAYPAFVLNGLAGCYLEMKDYKNAESCIDAILEANKNDYHAWRNKGQILADQGYWQDAIKFCQKAVELNPNYYEAWWIKGQCEFYMYNREDSKRSINRFLSLVPIEFDKIIAEAKEIKSILDDDKEWEKRGKEYAHFSFKLRDPSDIYLTL